jgi:hypothetical protein
MKKVWVSSLVTAEDAVQKVMGQLKTYGLDAGGHFWEDNLEKMAWIKARPEIISNKVDLWAILGSDEDLSVPSIRYGLSLLSLTVQAQRGTGFPIVILQTKGNTISPDFLPMPLKGAAILPASGAAFGAKLVAKVHAGTKASLPSEYRLDLYGNEHIGQWFEVGPREGSWSGAMFAIPQGEILFHGVGRKGSLPQKSVLNYPVQGLKLNLGDTEYTAWAVQNPIDPDTSYFVKVKGAPETLLFGPYSNDQEADVFVVNLK